MDAAISYKRFSTRKQARGDTTRRQTDLAEDYCRRHHLQLLDTFLDAGLSGFTGANLGDNSALRALLLAARNGKFPAGTRLIVESLDRLSRQEITTAVRLFLDILDTGLVIVTLIDGEQVFTKQRVDTDLTALIIAIVYLSRANNEAKARRERALHAQQTARRRARERKVPITAECPAWLTVSRRGRSRRFTVNNERAQVVGQIFKMSASGMGQYQIVAVLNGQDVPTFSGKPKWRPGMIGHLLSSPAVIGAFHPCLSVVENGKRRRVPDPEGPILDYFPAIISGELYEQGRHATEARLKRGTGRTVPAYTSLVSKIGRCAVCGAMLHHNQNVGGWAYLRCANARHKECSNRLGFPYGVLERVLLALDDLTVMVECLSVRRGGHEPEPSEWLVRFRAARADAQSADADRRALGRRSLIVELRRLLEYVVLHPDRTMSVHLWPNARGCRAVCLIGKGGLKGIQVKAPGGITGFIDRSALREIVPNDCDDRGNAGALSDSRSNLEAALERTRMIDRAHGDWQAFAPETILAPVKSGFPAPASHCWRR